jgi:hypothetical protein
MLEPVQMLWIGPTLPLLERTCVQSFLDAGHTVYMYTYEYVAGMPDNVVHRNAATILPQSQIFTYMQGSGRGSYAAFANLFRYKMLLDNGGWWVDSDVFCVRPWDFEARFVFCREPSNPQLIHNGIIKAPAGAPVMQHLYTAAKAHDHNKLHWGQTGSELMTQAARTFPVINKHAVAAETFCPIHWIRMPTAVMHPPKTLPENTCGVHLFQEMWRRRNLDRNTDQPILRWLRRIQQTKETV